MFKKFNPIFTIVTPSLNCGKYIEETIKSVLNQSYQNIEYIVVDGLSTDNTGDILKKYENEINKIIFKKDENMYQAIDYGFKISSGEILAWLNADDLYYKNAVLNVVNEMQNKNFSWINGRYSKIKEDKLMQMSFPYFYPQKFIQKGMCHKSSYGFIPQESTFFTKDLYEISGGLNLNLKYSGDFYLWKTFSSYEKLHPINYEIGIFRIRKSQLSSNLNEYYRELKKKFIIKKNFFRFFFSFIYSIKFYFYK